jgi:hypothetical protein
MPSSVRSACLAPDLQMGMTNDLARQQVVVFGDQCKIELPTTWPVVRAFGPRPPISFSGRRSGVRDAKHDARLWGLCGAARSVGAQPTERDQRSRRTVGCGSAWIACTWKRCGAKQRTATAPTVLSCGQRFLRVIKDRPKVGPNYAARS